MVRLLIVLLALFSISAHGAPSTRFIYSGIDFNIQSNASVIGSKGGDENFVFFRYGEEQTKKYLAFSDMSNDKSIKYGCKPKEFFSHLAGINVSHKCNKSEVESFQKYIVSDSDKGEWSGEDFNAYYFVGMKQSFLFVFKGKNLIKVDSDFLKKDGLKSLIKAYINQSNHL